MGAGQRAAPRLEAGEGSATLAPTDFAEPEASMPRSFTPDEANALLPRLREILAEMQAKKAELDHVRGELGQMTRTASGNGHLLAQQMDRRRRDGEALGERLDEPLGG